MKQANSKLIAIALLKKLEQYKAVIDPQVKKSRALKRKAEMLKVLDRL